MASVHGQSLVFCFTTLAAQPRPSSESRAICFRRFFHAFLSSGAPFFRRAFHVTLAR